MFHENLTMFFLVSYAAVDKISGSLAAAIMLGPFHCSGYCFVPVSDAGIRVFPAQAGHGGEPLQSRCNKAVPSG